MQLLRNRIARRKGDVQDASGVTLLSHEYARRAPVERMVERVWRGGPRVLAELLAEIGRVHGIADDIERRLASYQRLTPEILAAVGADRFAPAPMREIAP